MKKYIFVMFLLFYIHIPVYTMMPESPENEVLCNKTAKKEEDDKASMCLQWCGNCCHKLTSPFKECLYKMIVLTVCALQRCCGK